MSTDLPAALNTGTSELELIEKDLEFVQYVNDHQNILQSSHSILKHTSGKRKKNYILF